MPTEEEFREAGLATSRPLATDVVIEGGSDGGPRKVTEDPPSEQGGGSEAPPAIATTLAGLGNGDFDGHVGILRIGTYPDLMEEELIWNDSAGKWISARERVIMSTRDTWGMDLSNYALADIRNAWARFYSPLPYSKAAVSYLTSAQNLAALASNELAIHDSTNFAASGSINIRGQTLTYTGKGSGKLTGVSAGTGTMPANNTVVTQGTGEGGWGTDSVPLDNVDAMYTAGFELELRANAWINGSQDGITMSVAAYFLNVDADESFSLPPSPPSGGFGFGPILTGPAESGAANRAAERAFVWVDGSWETLSGTPTGRFLIPALYGRMNNAAAEDNGEVYGYTLRARWVSG